MFLSCQRCISKFTQRVLVGCHELRRLQDLFKTIEEHVKQEFLVVLTKGRGVYVTTAPHSENGFQVI